MRSCAAKLVGMALGARGRAGMVVRGGAGWGATGQADGQMDVQSGGGGHPVHDTSWQPRPFPM